MISNAIAQNGDFVKFGILLAIMILHTFLRRTV